ncbi:MAG: UDP-glucose 4-epimerase GalE [Chromatiales bacterium]|jgi:UDP-glucose 4-epimerase|nr:UDP-glucose 4-epimerase GalE [Chromatiales bacterium]MDP6150077.1 UDP-glucose 4-epimerase GalE [Gammaproteobacteria bacterium]MDP7270627.1 UDP-glucose 4-epimerase GalE [Gammaproteobacteria bacterium]HJP03735.1 UDP-glucose 4-epimerase GalE [Gammaproteobacteria bacterium]
MASGSILVTGGAGYIGSHVVGQLGEAGEQVVVLDNLSTGFRSAVLHGELVIGETGDKELVDRIIREHDIDTILHFAAHTIVPESVENPLKYYGNNTCSSRNLLECADRAGIKHFIFSSTAAVYGIPESGAADENSATAPINPYGSSKLMTEWMLRDLSLATDMTHVALRYFNVAGSDPECRIGQSTPNATLLTKVACEAAVGIRDKVYIFGTDYDTPDGTGLRDYIHVDDLARAHLDALGYLRDGGESTTLNCGYGHGYSVRDVLAAVEKANGESLDIIESPRRAGDPPILIAVADRIQEVLGWQPQHDDLDFIVRTSLAWEKRLLDKPAD